MDYIREELLRQRKALAQLLLGAPKEETDREEGSSREISRREEMSPAELEVLAASFAAERTLAEKGAPGFGAAFDEARRGMQDVLWEEAEEAARRSHRERGEYLRRGTMFPEEERVLAARREASLTWDAVMRRPEAWLGESGTEERLPLAAETVWAGSGAPSEAEKLSRVFQRDARRYDGGFTLY